MEIERIYKVSKSRAEDKINYKGEEKGKQEQSALAKYVIQ